MKDINTSHNKAIAHINLKNLHQDRFESIQEFRGQYLGMKKGCDVLELHCRRCGSDTWAIHQEKGVISPTKVQLKRQ